MEKLRKATKLGRGRGRGRQGRGRGRGRGHQQPQDEQPQDDEAQMSDAAPDPAEPPPAEVGQVPAPPEDEQAPPPAEDEQVPQPRQRAVGHVSAKEHFTPALLQRLAPPTMTFALDAKAHRFAIKFRTKPSPNVWEHLPVTGSFSKAFRV